MPDLHFMPEKPIGRYRAPDSILHLVRCVTLACGELTLHFGLALLAAYQFILPS